MVKAKTTRKPRVYRRKRRVFKRRTIPKMSLRMFETKQNEYRETETTINTLNGWYGNSTAMQLSQGGAYNQMTGHFVRGKGISWRGWVKNNATTTVLVRVGVALIHRGSAKTSDFFAGTDVLEGNTSNQNITTASSAARMTQRFNKDQYRLIRQRVFKLGNNSATDGSDVRTYKMWIPLKGKPFKYDGSGVFPANDVYALFVLPVLGNNDESTGENIEHSFTQTFYFIDP